jgi:hypothetical protein
MLEPRLLDRATAAAYCSLTPSRFSQLVKAGILPGPILRTARYDRKAIDRVLDKLSGLEEPAQPQSALDTWLAEDAKRSQR